MTHSSHSYGDNADHSQSFRKHENISKLVCNVFTSFMSFSLKCSILHAIVLSVSCFLKDFFSGSVLILEAMSLTEIQYYICDFRDMS